MLVPIYLISREGTFDYKPYYNYVIRMGIFAILFYANYSYLIEKYLFNRKFALYVVTNIALIVVLIILQTFVSECMRPDPEVVQSIEQGMQKKPPHMGRFPEGKHGGPPLLMRFIFDYVSIIFVIGLAVAIKTTIRWYRDSINFEKSKSVQLEADLRNLRSQLNPHFLFNTLNNIYSLIAIDQNRAQDAVHRLSNLLRYVMYDNDEKFVPLDKELTFTQNYIDLMKLRLSANVKLNVLIDGKSSHDMIASLMFITLIENAFKHVSRSKSQKGYISINLNQNNKELTFEVENSKSSIKRTTASNSGIGLDNVKKRLNLLYPNKHSLIISETENVYHSKLIINLSNDGESK